MMEISNCTAVRTIRSADDLDDDEFLAAREVYRILETEDQGEIRSAEQLLPLVYEELRALASRRLAHEQNAQTLQPTALVHEAYLRLAANGNPPWNGRGHFFAAAALAMRRILVENSRKKATTKRGGGVVRVPLEEFHRIAEFPEDLQDLDDALSRFAAEEPEKAQIVELRFFAGLSTPEAAEALGISLATAERWWSYSRAWLYAELQAGIEESGNS